MKKILIVFLSLICLVSFYSCNKKEKPAASVPGIKIASSLNVLYKENLVTTISYIPLRTSDDYLIQAVSKLMVDDSLIFVVDGIQNTIFIYDFFGVPVSKIHAVGNGLGEYLYITDAYVDPHAHTVNIYNLNMNKILSYDYSGNFIKDAFVNRKYAYFVIKQPASSFYISEMRDPGVKNILSAFNDKQIIDEAISVQNREAYAPYLACLRGSSFATYNDTVFFLSIFDYSIYSFKNGHFKKEYDLIMDDNLKISSIKSVPKSTKSSLDIIDDYTAQGIISRLSNLTISKEYISFCIDIIGKGFLHYNILYDRRTHESVFYEDLYSNGERLYQPPFVCFYKNHFLFYLQSQKELDYLVKTGAIQSTDYETPVICLVDLAEEHIHNQQPI